MLTPQDFVAETEMSFSTETCALHKTHYDSDDDLPPVRVDTSERVVKIGQKMNERASLPAHLCRGTPIVVSRSSATQAPTHVEVTPAAVALSITVAGPPKRLHFSYLSLWSLFHRRPDLSINRPAPVTPAQVLNPPFPQLRGGAESRNKVPPTLFWLAGGTGRKPISFGGWKQSRPGQRIGGLFGMAIFGDRYGQKYKVEAKVVANGEVECSVSVKGTVRDTVGIKEVEGGVVTSSCSPSAVSKAESVKEATAIAEEVVPELIVEPAQRGLLPPPNEPTDDAPLCSGTLPVGANVDEHGDVTAPSLRAENNNKVDKPVAVEKKKPVAS